MLYDSFTEEEPGPYGLWVGMPVCDRRRLRGGLSSWVNRTGEVLGYGHLHLSDLERIAREIPKGELFGLVPDPEEFRPYHERVASFSQDSSLVRLYLRHRIGIVVRCRELVLVTSNDKKLTPIERGRWGKDREGLIARGQAIPTRMLAWSDLDPEVQLFEIGRSKVLSLFDLPT